MKNHTVLLADDDSKDHLRFKSVLEALAPSLRINSMYNGIELVDYLLARTSAEKQNGLPDIIITDLYMPFAGGLQVLKKLRTNDLLKRIPVYVFSANYDNTIRTNVIENGATDFYKKPSEYAELEKIISVILKSNFSESFLQVSD